MKVAEIMTRNVTWVSPEALVGEIARAMRDEDIGSVPVAENDKLIGMVTDRDLVVRVLADGADTSGVHAREVMSPEILYCSEDQSVEHVLQNMGQNSVRRMPVVNSAKRLVGMVSLGDLSKAAELMAGSALKDISEAPPD